jgi:hypothetical protein
MPVIPAFERLRWKAALGYIVRFYIKLKKISTKREEKFNVILHTVNIIWSKKGKSCHNP